MVKKLLKFLSLSLFFIFALILFIPKENVYYFAEKDIKQFDVIVSNEKVTEHLFSLHLENLELSVKGIESALIKTADIKLLLLYNTLSFENIKLSSVVETYLPSKIAEAKVQYSLINPFEVTAKIIGDFGKANVSFHLLDKEIKVSLHPSKKMLHQYSKTLKIFKKSQNGEYLYAKAL